MGSGKIFENLFFFLKKDTTAVGHMMTLDQVPLVEGREIQSKALEKAGKRTLSLEYIIKDM